MAEAYELNDDQPKSKSLVVLNESEDYYVTLYIYSGWSPICKVANISKIISPLKKLFYQEKAFKFELVAILKEEQNGKDEQKKNDKEKKKDLLGPLEMEEDKLIRVTKSLECKIEKLADHPNRKRVCLREKNRAKELAVGADKPNLYQVLGLDMDEIRQMDKYAMKKAINKAYHNQMRIWHPDKNFGDAEIAVEIIMAKEILLDDERRARYHNGVDYDKGWLSPRRWKAIFWPDCYTKEQSLAFWKRIGMTALSLGLVASGIALTVCTGGAALPAIALCGFSLASWKSLKYAVGRDAVVDGVEVKKWLKEAGKGFVLGAVTGGIGIGITAVGEFTDLVEELGAATLETCKKVANIALEAAPKKCIKAAIKTGAKMTKDLINERLDDYAENQSLSNHVKSAIEDFGKNTLVGIAQAVKPDVNREEEDTEKEESIGTTAGKEVLDNGVDILNKRLGDHGKHEKSEGRDRYLPPAKQEVDKLEGKISYRSQGLWFSKMIVNYSLNGRVINGRVINRRVTKEEHGDGGSVTIPADAKHIQVKFQVRRPHWGFIMTYDRFKKEWRSPNEPHVFRYDDPVIRTFTISGNLWWEAVMKVNDEYHEETKEMS